MTQKKHYPFLDVALDIFFSVVLYNYFITFPGFNMRALFLAFSLVVVLNYWWLARSYSVLPKYYLFDLYFVAAIVFIFAQWSYYFNDIGGYLLTLATLFLVDAIYSFLSVYAHKEKRDEPSLRSFFISEILIAIIYFVVYAYARDFTWQVLMAIAIPYALLLWQMFRTKIFKTEFFDNDNQPY